MDLNITLAQVNALNRFAVTTGRGWREKLMAGWLRADVPNVAPEDKILLQQLRNVGGPAIFGGPAILTSFKPRPDGYKQIAYLKKARIEKFSLTRAWFVNAWRIVDAEGRDLCQPYSNTKADARNIAHEVGIFLLE